MNLAAITKKFIGRPYQLGEADCFSAILIYLDEVGVVCPKRFGGQTRESYPAYFAKYPVRAKKLMVKFIDSILPAIQAHQAFAGDILLLELPGKAPFLAIDGGNGNIIAASPERGIAVTPIRFYTILRAWQCRKHSLL